MTSAQQFVIWAESSYGKYLPAMKAEVEKWLSVHTGYFIAALREIVLRDHPYVYGKPPGVHELDAFKIEAYQRGHTLEAIEAAGKYKQIADPVEDVSEEEAQEKVRALRLKIGGSVEA